ncbi:MAG: flagellar basal body-associated FliL family protein [Acidobacteria bacterium]|nr:flagellar basal body-associated FliL family protein [Acidobacteriota bacterium]
MAEAETENINENVSESAPEARKPSNKLFFAGLAFVLLLGMAGLGWFLFSQGAATEEEEEHAEKSTPEVTAFLHLENFVVNLADPEEHRYLRVGIDLGLEHAMESGGEHGEGGELPTALIRDSILTVLSTWTSDALLTPEGKMQLKKKLVSTLQKRVPHLSVQEVYFNDFLVQR